MIQYIFILTQQWQLNKLAVATLVHQEMVIIMVLQELLKVQLHQAATQQVLVLQAEFQQTLQFMDKGKDNNNNNYHEEDHPLYLLDLPQIQSNTHITPGGGAQSAAMAIGTLSS